MQRQTAPYRAHIIADTAATSAVRTHDGLAVLSKGVFDKHGSDSEAQRAVCVADAQLPARRAALQGIREIGPLRKSNYNKTVTLVHTLWS